MLHCVVDYCILYSTYTLYPQWVFYFLVWGGILLLYSGSSTGQGRSGEAGQRPVSDRGDFDLGQDGVMRALDDLFSPSTIAKQNVINILGVRKKYCAYILCHPF